MSRAWAKGSTPRWRRIRARVLAENQRTNHGRCTLAIAGVCQGQATQAHHTRPRAEVGDDPAWLQAVCQRCNNRVSNPATSPTHQAVVQWVRTRGGATTRGVVAQFPNVEISHVHVILGRAVKRRELVRVGPGLYRAGPTGLPPAGADPQPRRISRW